MKELIIDNYRGKWVKPFEKTIVKGRKVACRFCQQEVNKKNRRRWEPYTSEQKINS